MMRGMGGITGLSDLFFQALGNVPGVFLVALVMMSGVIFWADKPGRAVGVLLGGAVVLDLLYWHAAG